MIDRDDGDGDVRPERAGALACEVFQWPLHVSVDRERDDLAAIGRGDRLIGRMGAEHRHRPAPGVHSRCLCLRDLVERNAAGVGNAIEHAVARAVCRLGRTIGPPRLGRLRDRDQQRRLRERQAFRLLAEIRERGRAQPLDVAAVRREAEIERKDVILRERAFELDRAHRLPQLRKERAIGARLEQARDLHGDGRAARDDAAVRHELERGARHRQRIDAVMLAEALVLIRDQQIEIARIDVRHGRGQSPAPIDSRIRPQQLAVTVHNDRGEFEMLAKGRGAEGMDPRGECRSTQS